MKTILSATAGSLFGLTFVAAMALFYSTACVSCPDRDELTVDENFIELGLYDRAAHSSENDDDHLHPIQDTRSYLEVISDDKVELTYEKDDQIVVETFSVAGREIVKTGH